ncbi:MAG TPA: BTAD domain-containing putative transcriptional regulator [Burkholderiaceae bacterium]|nr:BTAD domain-containing putative transcriptional regulator [Burkholderiaceae bacterium]HQR71215.1 BTAD domain-containing putative transcriptional regulator [Burkholderiaceae bacterium]
MSLQQSGRFESPGGEGCDLEPKDALLLAYLAIEGPTPRGRLAALLWPEVDEERARGNLRQRLLRLKRTTGVELVSGNPVAQVADGIAHDLADAHELLEGIDADEIVGLAEWLQAQRGRRRSARYDALDAAATRAEQNGELAAALEQARALVALDPLSEHAHRCLMRLHYLRGDRAAALAAYERCCDVLKRELRVAPSAETEILRRQIGAESAAIVAPRQVPVTVLRPPRMVGRLRELQAVELAWQQGRVALVLGEPGLGKSRLLTEFARQRRVLLVQGRPGDAGVPYATLARLLRQALERCEVPLASLRRDELARLLPELAPNMTLPADGQRLVLQGAVQDLLARVRLDGVPLDGVLVDDLHFADEASVEMLEGLIGAEPVSELRWALAQRPGEGCAAAATLRNALEEIHALECVTLVPLEQAQMRELISSLGVAGLEAAPLAEALVRHSGGNPFFALETIKLGLATGQLLTGRLPQPGSVGRLIERRLQQLSERALGLARVAAIGGVDFNIPLAEHVTGERALVLADAWRELESAQVLRDNTFAHDLVADAVLRTLPSAIAKHLHAEVARWLQMHDGEPARIAHHWLDAARLEEAIPQLMLSAERARRAGRAAEAGRFMLKAGETHERLGQVDKAFEAISAGAELLALSAPLVEFEPVLRDLTRLARTDAQIACAAMYDMHVAIERDDLAGIEAPTRRGLSAARRAGRRDLEAELLMGDVHICNNAGDYDTASDRLARSIALFGAEGMQHRVADKLLSLAKLEYKAGRYRESLRTLDQAGIQFETLRLPHMVPTLLATWAIICVAAGERDKANDLLNQLAMFDGTDTLDQLPEGLIRPFLQDRAPACLYLGQLARALVLVTDEPCLRNRPLLRGHAYFQMTHGLVMTELGRHDLAAPSLAALRAHGGPFAATASLLSAHASREAAALILAQTATLAERYPALPSRCAAAVLLAEAASTERALAELNPLIERGRVLQWNGELAGLLAARAVVLARAECTAEGARDAEEALQALAAHCSVHSAALIVVRCAEALVRAERLEAAARCLAEARQDVERIAVTLPPEFKEAYLTRNEAVRRLLEASRRAVALTGGTARAWLGIFRPFGGRLVQ